MKTGGLSLEQAPPLSIPAGFFLTIPVGILFAGGLVFTSGAASLGSPWTAQAVALTHIGTLGVLAMGMLGALYQMIPVMTGSRVPLVRVAHLVHVLLVIGLCGFLWRLMDGPAVAMTTAILCFTVAFLAFLLPVGWALIRPATYSETIRDMRIAVLALAVVSLVGLVMARGFTVGSFANNHMLWVQIHLMLALLGWVGGLLMGVSWQVIPMFYLAPAISKPTRRWAFRLLLAGLVLPMPAVFAYDAMRGYLTLGQLVASAAIPAAIAVWLIHPLLILRAIASRKRKRSDASLLFWKAGLSTALMLIPVAAAVLLLPDPRWQVLFGWLAIWGWAGLIMHGMLGRIVPFLVWFHRFSARVGLEPVPSMRSLLSQGRIQAGFYLHLISLLLGVATIVMGSNLLAQLTGLALIATAFSLFSSLAHVLRRRSAG